MAKWAKFSPEGVCLWTVTHPPEDMEGVYEAPDDALPGNIWLDNGVVKTSEPADIEIPSELDVSEDPVVIPLPPGAVALVNGEPHTGSITIPTDAPRSLTIDIQGSKVATLRVQVKSYVEQRKDSYPPVEEQLDALWKGLNALMEANGISSEDYSTMSAQIQAVKDAYPKPMTDSTI